MAVAESGFGVWAVRLEQASQALRPEARWLTAGVGGPLDAVTRMAASDVWGGPFADRLWRSVRNLDEELHRWGDHLGRIEGALEHAAREAENAVRLERAGIVPSFDLSGALAPWQRWPDPSPRIPSDWASAAGPGSVGVVWVDPDRARQLAEGMRVTAGQLRGLRNRVATALTQLGIDTPLFLEPVAAGLEDIAGEIDRRVTLLEQVDRELAGAFRQLAEGLGFPGLAPPKTFDPAQPIESAMAALHAGPEAGPGQQPTQAKEADPVSTSTGNYLCEAVDLVQQAKGIPTVFARTYSSLHASTAGPLGFGWSHSLDVQLQVDAAEATVVRGDGRHEHYGWHDGDRFVPPPGVHDRLVRLEGGFELQSKDGIVHRFDEEGRLTALVDPSGNTSLLERDDGRLVRVIDASGVVTDFEYDARGRIIAVHGVLGRRWLYAYSRRGDLETVTDPDGGVTTYSSDEEHRLVSIVDGEGATVVRNTYDGVGRVIEQRDGAGGRWRYSYRQNVTVVTDPVGHQTTYRFDDAYRTTAITDANGGTTIFSWDDADNLVGLTDPSRRAFRFTYNARGDPTSAEGPGTAPVKFEWDDRGNLTAVVSAQGHRAEFTWDDARRPTGLRSPAGVTTTITWRPDGLPECVTGGDGGTTAYRFNGAGHLISITDPLGAETAVECDAAGRPVVEAHPDGERMTFDWDRCDRLVGVSDDAGAVTRYSYDRCGRLTSITDPLGRTTEYAYGPLGFLASVTDPLGRQTTFDYDACGRLRTRTDPEGRTVAFSYDAGGRLVRIEAGDTTAIEYGWDPAGRLVSMTDGTGTTTWELDEAARPAVEHRPGGISLRHIYDELGRRRRLEVQQAEALVGVWDYGFDADAKITTVVDPQQRSTVLEYDAAGLLAALRHPNGVTSTWTYDAAGQPVVVSHSRPQLGVLSSWVNTFDAAGNLVRSERDLGHDGDRVVGVFDYDHLGRLTSAGGVDQPNSFGWDGASNRTSARQGQSVTTTTYDAADQVVASGTLIYRYDAIGNLVERAGDGQPRLACTYDGVGQVTELRAGEDVVAYQYDGLGRRVARTDRTGLTQRIYDGLSVVAELTPSGDAALETTAGLLVLHRQDSTGQYYLHADGNGNAGVVTDGAGALVAQYAYSAFGSRLPLGASPELPGPLGFCGAFGVRQDAGGLLDMRARLYDPDLGRFITPDPWPAYLPDLVTLNRYLYALGDPISQVDPLGLFCWTGKNKHGKCRGLGDVAERAGDVVENVAKVAEKPLSLTSKAAAGVAVVAAGVTAVCPVPCGVVSTPIAANAASISFYTGLGASASHCINSGVFTFDCAASAAGAAISGVSRSLFKTAVGSAGGMASDLGRMINFGGKIFSLFRASTGEAAGRMRK